MQDKVAALEKENELLKERLEKYQQKKKTNLKKKKWFFKIGVSLLTGKKLKTSIYNSLQEFNEQKKISLQTTSDLAASIIKRLTRIGVFALLFAVLPTTLMLYQNSLLKKQNKKIQDQTHLAEASRRSAQMFIMGDVLSDINTELNSKSNRRLSHTLVGRIVSLSRAMKPYKYLKEGQLIPNEISPERGQLLITLCKSKIEPSFFVDRILQESDFRKSELNFANLDNAVLRDVNLKGADFSNSSLINADARRSNLQKVNFSGSDLEDANLSNANLSEANLTGSILLHTNFKQANLENTIIENAIVHRADWLSYIKNDLKLKGAEDLYNMYKVDSVFSVVFKKKMPTIVKQ